MGAFHVWSLRLRPRRRLSKREQTADGSAAVAEMRYRGGSAHNLIHGIYCSTGVNN